MVLNEFARERRLSQPGAVPSWCGAVAQLGERLNGIQEVRGSIPLGSTTRFPEDRQPRFGDAKVAGFRRVRPPRSPYLRPRDAAAPNFPRNPPSVSPGENSDHSLEWVLSRELRNAQERVERDYPSHRRYRGIPLLDRLGSEGAQRAAGDEMALQVEGVVDGGMGGKKALSGSG